MIVILCNMRFFERRKHNDKSEMMLILSKRRFSEHKMSWYFPLRFHICMILDAFHGFAEVSTSLYYFQGYKTVYI